MGHNIPNSKALVGLKISLTAKPKKQSPNYKIKRKRKKKKEEEEEEISKTIAKPKQ